jgi:hypothetical protein
MAPTYSSSVVRGSRIVMALALVAAGLLLSGGHKGFRRDLQEDAAPERGL